MRDAARTLFDDRPRGGPPHMTYGEGVFDFYNRVDRADWARFRNELEQWYSAYPADDKDHLDMFVTKGGDRHLKPL